MTDRQTGDKYSLLISSYFYLYLCDLKPKSFFLRDEIKQYLIRPTNKRKIKQHLITPSNKASKTQIKS